MERSTKLADLKLVNKYYPPVSNYSYPRPEGGPRQERPVGRSSVGSDCSAPGMTDDQESDISAEDANQYHSAGDELWDKFWEDSESLCDAQMEEEEQQRAAEIIRSARYPALIPSQVARRKAAGLSPWENRRVSAQARNQEAVEQNASISCWPLIAAKRPVTPESKPAKASYSLFPQPKPTPVVNLTPRRPSRPPRSGFVWETALHCPSTVLPQSSTGRSTKPRKLHLPTSDGAISYNSASLTTTHSAPVSPTVRDPSPSTSTIARRSEPNALAQSRHIILPRICSDTTVLYSMTTNTASQETLTAPAIPPRSPQRKLGRHSRQHSQLRNSITPSEVSRTRSAAAAPRTRKGGDLAKEQLRRARAGTLSPVSTTRTATTTTAAAARTLAMGSAAAAEEREKEKDAVLLGMRRQRNEVFGRLFGGRW
ncbi:hypothetical protein VMCG_08488 [Cytospora schulzeri]|uniref:Uncharacterized protein n=1 Tax=Cytospora schulzeri TaxID=448051 RepID=A0A423VWN2_9PEZI|nr:hypothetical protein VMCG_08488 [Valsa malicola]